MLGTSKKAKLHKLYDQTNDCLQVQSFILNIIQLTRIYKCFAYNIMLNHNRNHIPKNQVKLDFK